MYLRIVLVASLVPDDGHGDLVEQVGQGEAALLDKGNFRKASYDLPVLTLIGFERGCRGVEGGGQERSPFSVLRVCRGLASVGTIKLTL